MTVRSLYLNDRENTGPSGPKQWLRYQCIAPSGLEIVFNIDHGLTRRGYGLAVLRPHKDAEIYLIIDFQFKFD